MNRKWKQFSTWAIAKLSLGLSYYFREEKKKERNVFLNLIIQRLGEMAEVLYFLRPESAPTPASVPCSAPSLRGKGRAAGTCGVSSRRWSLSLKETLHFPQRPRLPRAAGENDSSPEAISMTSVCTGSLFAKVLGKVQLPDDGWVGVARAGGAFASVSF